MLKILVVLFISEVVAERLVMYCLFFFFLYRELLLDFYTSSGKRKPDQIIIFRYIILLCLASSEQVECLVFISHPGRSYFFLLSSDIQIR